MCFRELGARNPSTIANTAAAIVRQAIAIVFDHAAAKASLAPSLGSSDPSAVGGTAAVEEGVAETPRTELALVLLRELCLLARGRASQALECGPPGAGFVLEVLTDTLRDNVELFRAQPPFLEVLREDVCGVLHHMLKTQREAEPETVNVRPPSRIDPCPSCHSMPRTCHTVAAPHVGTR